MIRKMEVSAQRGGREKQGERSGEAREQAELGRGQRLEIKRRKSRDPAGARNKKGEGVGWEGRGKRGRQGRGEPPRGGGSRGSEKVLCCGLLCVCHLEWYKL